MKKETLTPLFDSWLKEILGSPIPKEKKATCADCAMCIPENEDHTIFGDSFRPDVKCCSYVPDLPNFLVGRVLLDKDPAMKTGRKRLLDRIRNRISVTPLGIHSTPRESIIYENTEDGFGRSHGLVCPYFVKKDGGLCSIWRHRNSVCSTYFCKHNRGSVGQDFWVAVEKVLDTIQESLMHWCLAQLDIGPIALKNLLEQEDDDDKLSADEIDNTMDPTEYSEIWGKWFRKEVQYYEQCALLVEQLSFDDIIAICGKRVELYIKHLQNLYHDLVKPEIPDFVETGPIETIPLNTKTQRLSGHSERDFIDIRQELMAALPYFNGRTTKKAREVIKKKMKLTIDDKKLRELIDYDILIPLVDVVDS